MDKRIGPEWISCSVWSGVIAKHRVLIFEHEGRPVRTCISSCPQQGFGRERSVTGRSRQRRGDRFCGFSGRWSGSPLLRSNLTNNLSLPNRPSSIALISPRSPSKRARSSRGLNNRTFGSGAFRRARGHSRSLTHSRADRTTDRPTDRPRCT